jgi:polar amino acid transport system substrate-binding protein
MSVVARRRAFLEMQRHMTLGGVLFAAGACAAVCALGIRDAGARTLAEIQALDSISMCANPDALPYSSNRADLPGFQIEIAREVAHGLGFPLRIEWVVPRRRVKEVDCDMLLDRANDPDLKSRDRLLSVPYQKQSITLGLGHNADGVKSLGDLKPQQKIGVMVGSVASVVLGKRGVSISPYAFQNDMLSDVQAGQLAGAATASATLSYFVQQHPEAGLRLVSLDGEPGLEWTVSIGLRRADDALLAEVNRVVESLLADGTIERIYAKYGIEHRQP